MTNLTTLNEFRLFSQRKKGLRKLSELCSNMRSVPENGKGHTTLCSGWDKKQQPSLQEGRFMLSIREKEKKKKKPVFSHSGS